MLMRFCCRRDAPFSRRLFADGRPPKRSVIARPQENQTHLECAQAMFLDPNANWLNRGDGGFSAQGQCRWSCAAFPQTSRPREIGASCRNRMKPCGRPLAEASRACRADDDADIRVFGHGGFFLSGRSNDRDRDNPSPVEMAAACLID